MSTTSLFFGSTKFVGTWNSSAIYARGDIVKGSNNSAYKCKVSSSTGASTDPVTDTTNWEIFIPSANTAPSATQESRASNITFGINAGSTWNWRGGEWFLDKDPAANKITLVRVFANCDCNCNCNCTSTGTNCYSDCATVVDCTTDCDTVQMCNCGQQCNCTANCDCTTNCAMIDCNCASNCDCLCTYTQCVIDFNCICACIPYNFSGDCGDNCGDYPSYPSPHNCNCSPMRQNCETVDCNCTTINCDCASNCQAITVNCTPITTNCTPTGNCNCSAINCQCHSDCATVVNCGTNCNCAGNCNCNCTPI